MAHGVSRQPSWRGSVAAAVKGRHGGYIVRVTTALTPDNPGTPVPGACGREARPEVARLAEAVLPTIGVIAGDGIGPEVVAEGLSVLSEAAGRDGFGYETVSFDLGGERYLKTGEVLPEPVLGTPPPVRQRLLGAVGHPGVPPGSWRRGSCSRLRFEFHKYALNLRPVRLYPGVETPIQGRGPRRHRPGRRPRRTTKTSTSGAGGFLYKGTPEEVAIQTSMNTRAGVRRLPPVRVSTWRSAPGRAAVPGVDGRGTRAGASSAW